MIIDLVMAKMDGLEVLSHLARDKSTAAVIVTSGMGGRVLDAARRFADANGLDDRRRAEQAVHEGGSPGGVRANGTARERGGRRETPRHRRAWKVAEFQTAFRAAVMGDEMGVAYQPKIDLRDRRHRRLRGARAGGTHPERGPIAPDEFVPMAERFGIVSLSDRPGDEGGLRVVHLATSVPTACVSPSTSPQPNSTRPTLSTAIVESCSVAGISPGDVVLELTETSAMEDAVRSLQLLTRLRLGGFHLSLDDFGTGYSSMLQLARLPFTELKVDRSFVSSVATSEESMIVVRSVIDLGHALNMHLAAEGVEDAHALEILTELGCDYAQGYHVARPMSPDDIEAWADASSL